MKIHITKRAAQWYKEELHLENGDYIRFFPRYGGVGGNIPGFSIGINNSEPMDVETKKTVEGIIFYIEKEDLWYFDGKNLTVKYNEKLKEPEFHYE